jgi:hypothetical protein
MIFKKFISSLILIGALAFSGVVYADDVCSPNDVENTCVAVATAVADTDYFIDVGTLGGCTDASGYQTDYDPATRQCGGGGASNVWTNISRPLDTYIPPVYPDAALSTSGGSAISPVLYTTLCGEERLAVICGEPGKCEVNPDPSDGGGTFARECTFVSGGGVCETSKADCTDIGVIDGQCPGQECQSQTGCFVDGDCHTNETCETSFNDQGSFYWETPAVTLGYQYTIVENISTFGQVCLSGPEIEVRNSNLQGGGPGYCHGANGQSQVVAYRNTNDTSQVRNNYIGWNTDADGGNNGACIMGYDGGLLYEYNTIQNCYDWYARFKDMNPNTSGESIAIGRCNVLLPVTAAYTTAGGTQGRGLQGCGQACNPANDPPPEIEYYGNIFLIPTYSIHTQNSAFEPDGVPMTIYNNLFTDTNVAIGQDLGSFPTGLNVNNNIFYDRSGMLPHFSSSNGICSETTAPEPQDGQCSTVGSGSGVGGADCNGTINTQVTCGGYCSTTTTTTCTVDGDCPGVETCEPEFCRAGYSCSADSECPNNETCVETSFDTWNYNVVYDGSGSGDFNWDLGYSEFATFTAWSAGDYGNNSLDHDPDFANGACVDTNVCVVADFIRDTVTETFASHNCSTTPTTGRTYSANSYCGEIAGPYVTGLEQIGYNWSGTAPTLLQILEGIGSFSGASISD